MRVALFTALALAASLLVFLLVDARALSQWVVGHQRTLQNSMAGALTALRSGDVGAYAALFTATGTYGFVHALGPGHGKYLVGGVGFGSAVSTTKLTSIAVLSSLLQSVWAIVLVYSGFAILELSAQQLTFLAEGILARASYGAIGLVGIILTYRGVRTLMNKRQTHDHHHHDHDHQDCGCGHSHGPSAQEVAKLVTLRETVALVVSIAIRPCTSAVFLLVIAWQMDLKMAGALATIVLGFGTALLTSMVAVSSVAARRLALISADGSSVAGIMFPMVQIFAGAMIFMISIGLLRIAI